ncbi:hypothetical protein BCF50_1996 [Chryseobacterium daecheongense]|uniref:Uncharacterized protein n=1 Tax=Chryseobacterium daecheongense TaxID=192389 RepID=A0ABY2FVQ8_9FLAO|nr:hypothetical protein BCF50_1996 [Chryseobacterium daecheongense]
MVLFFIKLNNVKLKINDCSCNGLFGNDTINFGIVFNVQ